MNLNHEKLKLSLVGGAIAMTALIASAQALQPAKLPVEQQQPVVISSPKYIVNALDLGTYNDCFHDCHADVLTQDDKYVVSVNFDYSAHKELGIEIQRLEPEYIGDEYAEINAHLGRDEIHKINTALESAIQEKLGG